MRRRFTVLAESPSPPSLLFGCQARKGSSQLLTNAMPRRICPKRKLVVVIDATLLVPEMRFHTFRDSVLHVRLTSLLGKMLKSMGTVITC